MGHVNNLICRLKEIEISVYEDSCVAKTLCIIFSDTWDSPQTYTNSERKTLKCKRISEKSHSLTFWLKHRLKVTLT